MCTESNVECAKACAPKAVWKATIGRPLRESMCTESNVECAKACAPKAVWNAHRQRVVQHAACGHGKNVSQTCGPMQVILKPDPGNPQELYLGSLEALGIDTRAHDVHPCASCRATASLILTPSSWFACRFRMVRLTLVLTAPRFKCCAAC